MHAAREAERRGATRLVVVHADLPLLRSDEITALLAAAESTGFAVAPDQRGTGTNALCVSPLSRLRLHFGPASLERHLAEAAAHGLSPAIVRSPGLAFDVDETDDLRAWRKLTEEAALV
jgi:2-phospho-L-lactate guanylyltransferase